MPGFVDETRGATPVEGGILRRRLVGEPATLNAVLQSSLPEQQVLQYLARQLLDFDARLLLVPGLAERWEVSEDGREYRFFLRPREVWEDGSAVTSADAVFTIRQITDPKIPSPVFKPLFDDLELVEATSPTSFRARFRNRDALHAYAFAMPLLPERRFSGRPFAKARENRAPLSNGPYRLSSWKTQDAIELERNPRWSGPPAHFDRIVFRIVPDATIRVLELAHGSVDLLQNGFPPYDQPVLAKAKHVRLEQRERCVHDDVQRRDGGARAVLSESRQGTAGYGIAHSRAGVADARRLRPYRHRVRVAAPDT